jgi:single-strand DNA-binding protein
VAVNTVTLSGRATRDPEGKEIGSDNYVVNFGIAVDRRVKQGEEYVNVPNFFDVAVFGGYAKLVEKKLRKGDLISLSGELRYETWENEAGEKRSKVSVVARDLDGEFQYRKADGSDTPAKADGAQETIAGTVPGADAKDDIPF